MDGTISMSALEQVLMPGCGNVKLVILSRRAPELQTDDFRQ